MTREGFLVGLDVALELQTPLASGVFMQVCGNAASYQRASEEPFRESNSNCSEEFLRGLIKDKLLPFPSVCIGQFPFRVSLETLKWRS